VINADSDRAPALMAICARRGVRCWTYGAKGREFRLLKDRATSAGQHLAVEILGELHGIELPLVGGFQASNALGALALAVATGGDVGHSVEALGSVTGAPGRLQLVARHRTGANVYVDYAHKPEALETVLTTLRPFARGRLVVVFGCGGDRDKGKRPFMGRIAAELADVAIVTSDNPRTEDPGAIIDDIEQGMGGVPHLRIPDRLTAIHTALDQARAGDTLLLAGKGHETYQVLGTEKVPFDEREIVGKAVKGEA
jgi:UDP-N-acetylmuramoyl-L-alanyl-D-glutamate--2,6-diaminopimelate ligase